MITVIIEDEALASSNLIHILSEIGSLPPIAILESIADTIEWFSCHESPDIVFLDIHLADGSAFEIFKHIEIMCPIVFTTAYDEYALEAFKVNSIDYLLKPMAKVDVIKALNKFKNISKSHVEANALKNFFSTFKSPIDYRSSFLVSYKGDKLVPLNVRDIAFIYIDISIVKAVCSDGRTFIMEFTLDELIALLNPRDFYRANRQFIISRESLLDIDLWFNSRLCLNLKVVTPEKILVSKARISHFKEWFAN